MTPNFEPPRGSYACHAAPTLKAARAIISNPDRWTKNAEARDEHRYSVSPEDPSAVQWCAIGAIRKAASEIQETDVERTHIEPALNAIIDLYDLYDLGVWNDHPDRTHAEVLSLFDRTITIPYSPYSIEPSQFHTLPIR